MSKSKDHLVQCLKDGPAILFLGQNYLKVDLDFDPFLKAYGEKYNLPQLEKEGYNGLFNWKNPEPRESVFAAISNELNAYAVPEYLKTIGSFPWNSIYTSSIDANIQRIFTNEWRTVQPTFEDGFLIANPRNQYELNLTYLYGDISQLESNKRPPLTKKEFIKRDRNISQKLLRRLPSLITPRGVLVLEGYDPELDWFSDQDLYALADELGQFQIHLFNCSDHVKENEFLVELAEKNHLTFYDYGLAEFLVELEQEGEISLTKPDIETISGKRIFIKNTLILLPLNIWNRIIKTATVMSEDLFGIKETISENQLYAKFEAFISSSTNIPKWEGYPYEFAFKREFIDNIKEKIIATVKQGQAPSQPFILHGQTSSGKTIGLGLLAYELSIKEKIPVLFIERKYALPDIGEIDFFWEIINEQIREKEETVEMPFLVIVWDGMLPKENYYEMQYRLNSRGRKTIVIGSQYLDKRKIRQRRGNHYDNYIEASIDLDKNEKRSFEKYLSRNIKNGKVYENILREKDTKNFFVLLYHYLKSARKQLKVGARNEAFHTTNWILKDLKKFLDTAPQDQTTPMEDALRDAGISITEIKENLRNDLFELSGRQSVDFKVSEQLLNLVMVPGQMGLEVPLELLLRCLDVDSFQSIVLKTLESSDVLRWQEDQLGNYSIKARTTLEARLLVQNIGDRKGEMEYLKKLLGKLRIVNQSQERTDYSSSEVQFGIELLRIIGPNSDHDSYKFRYKDFWREIAEILKKLRTSESLRSPRMMLQESNILREIVREETKALAKDDDIPEENLIEYEAFLQTAELVSEQAMELLENKNSSLYLHLRIELAANLGTRMNLPKSKSETTKIYDQVKNILFNSKIADPSNYPAFDVFFWVTRDLLNIHAGLLGDKEELEIKMDLQNVFLLVEEAGIMGNNLEKFYSRQNQLGDLIKDIELSDQALQHLKEIGSTAGYFFQTRKIIGEDMKYLNREENPNEQSLVNLQKAYDFLNELITNQNIPESWSLHYLLFKLWWVLGTKHPIFPANLKREGLRLKFSKRKWQRAYYHITRLLELNDIYNQPALIYLKGLIEFHLGNVGQSIGTFRELGSEDYDGYGSRRIMKMYLATDEKGNPIKYNGQSGANYDLTQGTKLGNVYVSQLFQSIPFSLIDFNLKRIQKGENLDAGFYIGFNFRGPIAIPLRRVKNA